MWYVLYEQLLIMIYLLTKSYKSRLLDRIKLMIRSRSISILRNPIGVLDSLYISYFFYLIFLTKRVKKYNY